ncbi:MAG TPA: DUF4350 domain-containing protein [Acidobacteriota bacterium]|nr:DUF4350 domain-containing protein [Acidobacteriota bacterium]
MSFTVNPDSGPNRLNWMLLALSLLLTFGLAVLLGSLSGESRRSVRRQPSTFFTDDSGMRAALLVLQRFTSAERWRSVLLALPSTSQPARSQGVEEPVDTFIVAHPRLHLSPGEAERLRTWLEDGGQAILCLESDWLIEGRRSRFRASSRRQAEESPNVDPDQPPDGFLKRLGIVIRAAPASGSVQDEGGESAEAAAGASPPLRLESGDLIVEGQGLQVIAQGPRGPRAVWKTVGRGRLAVISDPLAFSNSRLRESDNAIWLVRTAASYRGGQVAFDEYHHGFGSRRRMVSLLWDFATTPWGWMCLQITLALLAYLLIFQARFGRVEEAPPPRRASPLEWIDARAGLLQAAGAGRLCARWMHRSLALRLSRSVGYSVDIDEERVQRKLSLGEHSRARSFRDYLLHWRNLPQEGTVTPQQLTELAQAAGKLAQELKSS